MRRYARLIAVAAFIFALWALSHFTQMQAHFTPQFVHDSFEAHPVIGVLIFVASFSIGNLIQVPGWVFLVAAVLTLGEWWGGALTYLAASVSCVVTFVLIRLIGGNALRTFEGRFARQLFARLDAHPIQSIGLLRVLFQTVPALNYALALSGVRFRSYLVGTLVGLPLPIAVYCVFLETLAHWLGWSVP
ncbi:MAG TPA: VTT domain-containing protein [Burkholderiaceae bacterium]|nr:VTT domain-containing protein [Burkholderiaceae bacterium]